MIQRSARPYNDVHANHRLGSQGIQKVRVR